MRSITITKANLDKEKLLTVDFTEVLQDGTTVTVDGWSSTATIHDDLDKSFRKLNKHLASICDQFTTGGAVSDKVECRSFTLSGKDEDKRAIILSGWKSVMETKGFAINTPLIFFLRDAKNYPDMDELVSDLTDCKQEIYRFIVEGKHKPNPQMALEFEKSDATPVSKEKQVEVKEKVQKNKAIALPVAEIPENVANQVIQMAGIEVNQTILLAPVGNGELLKAIRSTDPSIMVDCLEKDAEAWEGLKKKFVCINQVANDMSNLDKPKYYDRIVGCPPQVNNLYVDHMLAMYDALRLGGRMAVLVPMTYTSSKEDKVLKFRSWLDVVKAKKVPLDFKKSTDVLILIDRPSSASKK